MSGALHTILAEGGQSRQDRDPSLPIGGELVARRLMRNRWSRDEGA